MASAPHTSAHSISPDLTAATISLTNCCGERGLIGFAFHPNYPTTPYVFAHFTSNGAALPDEVFPNNWLSLHADGTVVPCCVHPQAAVLGNLRGHRAAIRVESAPGRSATTPWTVSPQRSDGRPTTAASRTAG